jgi:type IV pilus assembly protein PilM
MASKRNRTVVGLDIEPSHLAAAEAIVNGRVAVQRAAVGPLAPGLMRDGEVTDVDGLSAALKDFFAAHKLPKRVRLGVANQRIVVRTIELPILNPGPELEAAVRFHAQENIPMPLDQAVLDYQVTGRVEGEQGERLRVVLVAARRDMIDRVLAAVRDAGLRPEGIDLAAFGMVRALHHHGQAGETVVYLSVGGVTNLAVAQGTVCTFTRVIGGGLEGLAVELAERRSLTLEHARGWLAHVGLEQPAESLSGYVEDHEIIDDARAILIDGVHRIAGEVRNSVDFHQGYGAETGVQRCVLTGPALGVAGFAEALSADLGLPVAAGELRVPPGLEAGRLAVAAGLAIEEALVA